MPIGVVCAVHGFLGEASDWQGLKNKLSSQIEFHAVDLFKKNHEADVCFSNFVSPATTKKIFLGYSFGGRLGLNLLAKNPEQFDHYILVSVNPGISDEDFEARKSRLQQDLHWADKITEENWLNFLRAWNAQSVFENSRQEPIRSLSDFDIPKLKQALIEKSLAKQPDYRELIKRHQNKISWVVGSQDKKFFALAKELKENSIIKNFESVDSGHRVLFDNPDALEKIINSVINM